MGQTGRFYNDLEAVFGKGNVTSGYRTQEEQDALVRAKKTRATRSDHTYEDGYDVGIGVARSATELQAKAAAGGFGVRNIRRESGQGNNQGTGPHWHGDYYKLADGPKTPSGKPVNSSSPGIGVADPSAYLDGLESSLAPESKASQNVSSSAGAIFSSDAELRRRGDAVEQQLDVQGQTINILDAATQALQSKQTEALALQVEDTQLVSDEIVRGTDELKRQVTPVFQARTRIADQLDKITTMNPLERGIRGIFDLNYDKNYLTGQLDQYDRTLKSRGDDYDYMNKLHTAALNEIERRYGLSTAIPTLAAKQVEEDLGIVGMRLQQTAGMLGNLKDRVGTESQMIAAKAGAREDMLGRLDSPTVLDLANQAKAHGGVVTFNGVELSYHELRGRLENDEHTKLAVESTKMAIANGRMDLAQAHATNLARSLTREQLAGAMANGGVYQGVQLPQDVLTQAYQGMISRDSTRAAEIASNLPNTMAYQIATDSVNQITNLHARTRGLFGPAGAPGAASYLQRGSELTRALIKATEDGSPPEVVTALTQQIADNSKAMTAAVDAGILRTVGGDKRAAGYVGAFVSGVPMDAATATQAITYFALKGGMPRGLGMSDESTQLFKKAQTIALKYRGTRNPATGKEYTIGQLEQVVNQELTKSATATIGMARTMRVMNDLPNIAARTGDPLGKMDQKSWRQANQAARVQAATVVARKLDTTAENVLTMATKVGPLSDSADDAKLFEAFKAEAGTFNSVEQSTLLQELDDLPQVTPGRRNSSLVIDFMRSPKMQGAVETYTQARGSMAIGDYLTNPMAAGATEGMLTKTVDGLESQRTLNSQAAKANARRQAAAMAFDPINRVSVILRSIDGLGKPGTNALLPTIKRIVQDNPDWQDDPNSTDPFERERKMGVHTANTVMVRQETMIRNKLSSMKFEDPQLETYRKLAIRGWEGSATQQNSFLENMLEVLGITD